MRRILRIVVGAILAGVTIVTVFFMRFPPDPLWFCQKAMDSGIEQYFLATKTNVYPNVEGDSDRSFRLMAEYMAPPYALERIVSGYAYVPGLIRDDPKDLVLLYLKKPTRKTWNGDHSPSIFSKKRWMVAGPDFWWNGPPGQSLPEGGRILSTAEFKKRLEHTLVFLSTNERPYWQVVVKEHSAFLASLRE